jgi:hypothetical protein
MQSDIKNATLGNLILDSFDAREADSKAALEATQEMNATCRVTNAEITWPILHVPSSLASAMATGIYRQDGFIIKMEFSYISFDILRLKK